MNKVLEDDKYIIEIYSDYIELFRLRLVKYMATSYFGRIYETLFIFLSVFSAGQYIYQSYSGIGKNRLEVNYKLFS